MSFPTMLPIGSPAPAEPAAGAGVSVWPATTAAAAAELARLAGLLAEAGATVVPAADTLTIPHLACGPGDTAGVRVRTTGRAPHALYIIAAGRITPHAGADSAFADLHPLLEAAARPCEGCDAEAGTPCNPHCLPDPSTT
ncbi:hypothetical protein ACIGHB_29665 [Streptomyces sp. NPDC085460]|uniref:hypothetical protein n=1 Tax=Streptomyces sp. NPDC085460 TaxID=3365723 RepID=UPI0037D681AF